MRLFRPPAEAYSLIIRVAEGCPWNQCTFCAMYKGVSCRFHSPDEQMQDLRLAQKENPMARRIFLADGDVMALPFDSLKRLLEQLNELFPRLARVNLYANGASILKKTPDELRQLKALKLNTLYMGLESGCPDILRTVKKCETAQEMVEAGVRAQDAGLKMSVMILVGLGGQKETHQHAKFTANVLNQMQPRLLSALRVIPIPGTELYASEHAGEFVQLTERQAVEELQELLQNLNLDSTLFRANHSSNIYPLEGRFPKDKERLLAELQALLDSGTLDAATPGPPPLSL